METKEKQPFWDNVKIIDSEEHWKKRRPKKASKMLGYVDLLSKPSIEMNTIWEPIFVKAKSNRF